MRYLVPGPLPCPEVVAVFYIRPAEVPTLSSVEGDAQVEQQNTVVGFLTIYVSQSKSKYTFDWRIAPSPVPTNHWLVTVKYAPKNAPYIGEGRWTWPLNALSDKKIMDWVEKRGISLQEELNKLNVSPNERSETKNPQTMWKRFKVETNQWVANAAKIKHYKQLTKIQNLKKDREEILANQNFEESGELQWHETILASEIEHLEKATSQYNQEKLKAKIAWHSERLGGTWSNLSKPKKPRDAILRLSVPDTPTHQNEVQSDRMAELAQHYHNTLQAAGLNENVNDNLPQKMEAVLQEIPEEQKFQNPGLSTLNKGITKDTVDEALNLANGCPYKLWKELRKRHKDAEEEGKTGFDIIRTLTIVFQNIQYHGIALDTYCTSQMIGCAHSTKRRTGRE